MSSMLGRGARGARGALDICHDDGNQALWSHDINDSDYMLPRTVIVNWGGER